jgi:hypothetical protein
MRAPKAGALEEGAGLLVALHTMDRFLDLGCVARTISYGIAISDLFLMT